MIKRALLALTLSLGFVRCSLPQASPYNVSSYPTQQIVASGATSDAIALSQGASATTGASFGAGTISVTGNNLTTATFAVQGSNDGGVTYFPLYITSAADTTTGGTTITVTANGLYQVNLAGLTHVRFVTSGTFTASGISLKLTASPNASYARKGGTSSGGSGTVSPSATAGPNVYGNTASGSSTIAPLTAAQIVSAIGATPVQNAANLVPQNPLPIAAGGAEYALTEGTGTTLTDISGNSNNGTFIAGQLPVWTSYGLSFNDTGAFAATYQGVTTPATDFGAIIFYACTPTLTQTSGVSGNGTPAYQFATLFGSSTASTGMLILSGTVSTASPNSYMNSMQPTGFSLPGNTITGQASGIFGGCHRYAYLRGNPDTILVDGQVVNQNVAANSLGIGAIAGNYTIGVGRSNVSNTWRGTLGYFMIYPRTQIPTVAQAQAISEIYMLPKVMSRATQPKYPVLGYSRTPVFVAGLDSLTATYLGTTQWTASLGLTKTYSIINKGIFASQLVDFCAMADVQWAQYAAPGSIIQIWGGTNDLGNGRSQADVQASMTLCTARAHSLGFRVIVATMWSGVSRDTAKNLLNPWLRANWKTVVGADYLNDVAEPAKLGADAAYTDTTNCFQADQVHGRGPGTGGTGGSCLTLYTAGAAVVNSSYGAVATMTSNAINTLDGSTQTAPKVVSAASYNMAYADNYLNFTPTAASAPLNLVDCLGQSSPRSVYNPSATLSIVAAGVNSETISGSTTIAPLQTAVFTPLSNDLTSGAAAVGGCSWLRGQMQ